MKLGLADRTSASAYSTFFVITLALVFLFSGCSFRTKKIGSGDEDEHIPYASAEGVLKNIYFDYDSFSLSSDARAVLDQNAEWLLKHGDARITVEGHCDERGTGEYNMVLGSNRAKAVHDFLRGKGIDGERMTVMSYGEELPLDPRSTEEAYAKNRRVHFDLK